MVSIPRVKALIDRWAVAKAAERANERPILPVIVTNSQLGVVEYEAATVPLGSGELALPLRGVRKVPWVRFRKSFTAPSGRDTGDRTVFVVYAPELGRFLEKLDLDLKRSPLNPVDLYANGRVL